jgi:hypothetical protein
VVETHVRGPAVHGHLEVSVPVPTLEVTLPGVVVVEEHHHHEKVKVRKHKHGKHKKHKKWKGRW